MSIKYNYQQTGDGRRALAQAVSSILETPAVYRKTPTFSYDIGFCSIDKNGVLSCNDNAEAERMEQLIRCLKERGYEPSDTTKGQNTLTVEIPRKDITADMLMNLQKIVASRDTLLRKALGAQSLDIIDTGSSLRFPWFTLHGLEGEVKAYCQLSAALCQMAREKKRIIAKEKDSQNDKFDLRLFLVRLGFIGDEYKAARRILLRNLTGNSSWKSGHRPEPRPDTEVKSSAAVISNTDIKETGKK